MAKNFSKNFSFLGFDFGLSVKENNKKEHSEEQNMSMTGEKYTDSEEYKKAHANEKITYDKIDGVGVAISLLSGYGAFKIVSGIAKTAVKSSIIGNIAVMAFEGFAFAYASAATFEYYEDTRKAMKAGKEKAKDGESRESGVC